MNRRKFMRLSAQAGVSILANDFVEASEGSMPLRVLGGTGE